MTTPPEALEERLDVDTVRRIRGLAGGIAVSVMLAAVLVLAGYAFGFPVLTVLKFGLQAMSVMTAACLVLLALALAAELMRRPRLSWVLCGVVTAVGAAMLCSHAFHGADVISQPLAHSVFGYPASEAGRTSLATAVILVLIAMGLLLNSGPRGRAVTVANVTAALGLFLSGVAVVCYAYDVRDLYALKPFDSIAVHTAVSLFLLCLGVLMVHPERGWVAIVASGFAGGGATRRQLAFTLLIPLLGGLLLRASAAQNLGPGSAVALLVVLTSSSLALLILRDGHTLNSLDAERRARAAHLAQAKAEVDAELRERVAALAVETQERQRVEEALRQSQKLEAIGQLTGGVAHDFNNLLTVIRSSVDLLARPDLPEERRSRYIAAISDTVTRAARLTGQLLAFARRQALKPEVFDAGKAVTALGDMVGTLTGARIAVLTEAPDTACFIKVDPSQFDTALVNMAVNARDAMNGEGRLTIDVQPAAEIPPVRSHPARSGDFVVVRVTDTGAGIAPERMQQIFEPFFTTKGVGHGTGLGLSQVFGFAKQSGGDVRVESEVGTGTTFFLYLPRVPEEEQALAAEPEPLVDGHGTQVLVVEDNVEVGTFATQTLTELGYRTVWAADAQEGLSVLAERHAEFDVVFSDVVMPGMNGIALAQEIRRLYVDLPVVLTSGYSHVLAQNGTYGFELLHKPYSVEELSRILRKAASWRRRRRILTATPA